MTDEIPDGRANRSLARHDSLVLALIRDSVTGRGYPPTRKEIAEVVGGTPMVGQRIVERLEREGLIRRAPGVVHGIAITESGMKAITEEMT